MRKAITDEGITRAQHGLFSSVRHRLRRTPIHHGWQWVTTAVEVWRHAGRFAEVRTYCLFVGHGRSGHSVIGAMLDAHPEIILSDELDALKYVEIGFSRNQVFSLSAKLAENQARSQRRKSGRRGLVYSYFVPDQWQGYAPHARVVGDSRAAGTVKRLARNPLLLDRLRTLMAGIELRFVHVVRNPFDTIATMMLRTGRSFESAFEEYFRNWDAVCALRGLLQADELLMVSHEALIGDPRTELSRLCSFLGVDCEDGYVEACAAILYSKPSRTRDSVIWMPGQQAIVADRAARFDELRNYLS